MVSPEAVRQCYNQVMTGNGPNYCNAKVTCESNLNIQAWRKYEHIIREKDSTLVDQLAYGFTMGIDHNADINIPLTNHLSARNEPQVIDEFLTKHYKQKSMLGPYSTNPLPVPVYPSPLQVATSASGKKRAVIDMSYPANKSVNSAIPRVWTEIQGFDGVFKLPTHDRICQAIVSTPDPVMFITDCRGYYMQIPSDWRDTPYMVITWRKAIWLHRRLPFGCRSSCLHAQRVTDAVCLIFTRIHAAHLDGYVDDYVSVVTIVRSASAYAAFHGLLHELGVERSEEKDQTPHWLRIFLGLQYNLRDMLMSIPEDKVLRVVSSLHQWLEKHTCTKSQVQTLLGHFNHLAAVVHAGRPFMASLVDILRQNQFPAPVTEDLKKDINVWLTFLQSDFNGASIIKSQFHAVPDSVLTIAVNGQSCVIECDGSMSAYMLNTTEPFLPQKAMYTVATWLAVNKHSEKLRDSVIKVSVPTKTAAVIINRAKTDIKCIRTLLRQMWAKQAKYDYVITAIPQQSNNFVRLYGVYHEFKIIKLPK